MNTHQGKILKQLTDNHRIKVDELADLFGISRQAIYGVFGQKSIKHDRVEKFCQTFGIDKSIFYGVDMVLFDENLSKNTLQNAQKSLSNRIESLEAELQTTRKELKEWQSKYLALLERIALGKLDKVEAGLELTKHRTKQAGSRALLDSTATFWG